MYDFVLTWYCGFPEVPLGPPSFAVAAVLSLPPSPSSTIPSRPGSLPLLPPIDFDLPEPISPHAKYRRFFDLLQTDHPLPTDMHSNQQQQQQRLQDSPGGGGGGSEFGSQHYPWPGQLPSLHLYPLSDSFVPKQIYLPPGVRVGGSHGLC